MWDVVIGRPGQGVVKSQAVIAISQPRENNSNVTMAMVMQRKDIRTLQMGKLQIHSIFTTKELKKLFYPNGRWKFLVCHYSQSETLVSTS